MAFVDRSSRSRVILCALLALLMFACVDAFAQSAPALRVIGDVPNHLALSLADFAALKHSTIHVTDDQGASVEYAGASIAAILEKSGASLGKQLKGPNMAVGVVASAPDGYHVLFSLAEFDSAFSDRVIILADRRNGKALDNREGPLRIVVPGDKRHARWIRGVNTLEVVRVK